MIKKNIKKMLRKHDNIYEIVRRLYHAIISFINIIIFRSGSINYFKCNLSSFLKLNKSLGHPVLLSLEITNICDQQCTICETGLGILDRTPKSMTFEDFKFICNQFDKQLKFLYLYFMGETFLNKHVYEMIRYAADREMYVSVCTNGNTVIPEKLIHSGISEIWFQVSGTTQDIHDKYRRGGDLEKVLNNVRKTIELRENNKENILKEKYPMKIGMGYILMKNNEHQLNEFIKLAKDLNVDEYHIIPTCARTIEQAHEYLPSDKNLWPYDPHELEKGKLVPRHIPHNYCEWIYYTATIQVNGDVVLCCRDPKGEYVLGNVFKDNFYTIWNNKQYQSIRNMVSKNQKALKLCSLCEGYGAPKK